MIGPCLCGDPYCPSCGDPAGAAMEEAAEAMIDEVIELCVDQEEMKIYRFYGSMAVHTFREFYKSNAMEVQADHQGHVDYLLGKIDALEHQLAYAQGRCDEA